MKHAISHINGTATMHSILEASGIGPGDEVIVPPLTMASTTFVVLQAGATPVFADVDYKTFQISAESIAQRITDKTKAIITVALYGLSPDMDPIMDLAKKHNLLVIEDTAECFLGKYKGKLVGTIGHASSFSFQSSKHLTAGEGGIVLTKSDDLAVKIRRMTSLGYAGVSASKGKITKKDIQDPNYSRHVQLGWNYRMPELCCAVALAQTERMEELVQQRIKVAGIFQEVLANTKCEWLIPQKVTSDYVSSFWGWAVRLEHQSVDWYTFIDTFVKNGGDGIYAAWKLTYLESMFEQMNFLGREKYISEENINMYKQGLCPNAEKLQPRILAFKNNYWDIEEAQKQGEILRKTINQLS
jgi:perosamine synthetase